MTGVYKDVNLRMYVHKGLADDFIEKPFRGKDLLAQDRAPARQRPGEGRVAAGRPGGPGAGARAETSGGNSVDQDLDDLISWAHSKGKK